MKVIADKFKAIGNKSQSKRASSSLFGDTNLSQAISTEKTRIGLYPIVSQGQEDLAMGVASCVSYLLDQYSDFRVYRVFAKVTIDDSDTEITEDDYQFSPDQWEFVGLDDNVAVSGALQFGDNDVSLQILVDLDLTEEQESVELTYHYPDLSALVLGLSTVASDIIGAISDRPQTELIITYSELGISEANLVDVLQNIFYWNLDLYLYLWDVDWTDEEIEEQFQEMVELNHSLGGEFVAWCTSMMAKQVMQVGLDVIGEVLVPYVSELAGDDISTAILSMSLINMGYIAQALDMIEQCEKNTDTSLHLWFSIINVYLKANQFKNALDNNQLAMELGVDDHRLYWMYYQLLSFAEEKELFIEDLLFIDPDVVDEDEQVIYEIIETLKRGLQTQPNSQVILYTLLKYLVDVNHEELWTYFSMAISTEILHEYVKDIIEQFYDLYDLSPAYDILEAYKEEHPQNPFALIYLAQLYLLDGEMDEAQVLLKDALAMIDAEDEHATDITAEIQRMLLTVSLEDFESRYADILVMLDANRTLSDDDAELLEAALEIAPQFADIYVTLAKCYVQWNDTETAMEVLSDAENQLGSHPSISLLSSHINWDAGQKETALQQINTALEESPNDIALLAQMARFLIENQQFEDSKPYIERAEIIAPSHPNVWNLRKLIAENINR